MEDVLKVVGIIVLCLGAAVGLFFLGRWGYNEYLRKPEFYVYSEVSYSANGDSDVEYDRDMREFSVDSNCFMKYKVKIGSSNKRGDGKDIYIDIAIPKVDHVQARSIDGKTIEPERTDTVNNITYYRFKVKAYKDYADKPLFVFIFEFIPNSTGYIDVTFDYEDPISSAYDGKSSIKFVDNGEMTE